MKVQTSVEEAIHDIHDGATIMVGGFGLVGIPEKLIEGVFRKGIRNLTILSNNCGIDDDALGTLLTTRSIDPRLKTMEVSLRKDRETAEG